MKDEELSQSIIVIPGSIVLGFVVGLYQAYVVAAIWNWFAVQRLGAPALPVLVTYGLLICLSVASLTRGAKDTSDKGPWGALVDHLVEALIRVTLGWGLAYVIHLVA